MGASGTPTPAVLQLHPSRRCPLRCRHCYSLSGPEERQEVALPALLDLMDDAAALGYETVAVSGGEPLAYPHLEAVVEHARGLGLRVTLTTSGVGLTPQRAAFLARTVDVVAVSCDGPAPIHDAMRRATGAFERMARALALLRSAGATFGVLNTVTAESWRHMPWVAELAETAGASLVQFHPLEPEGRARSETAGALPDAAVLSHAWLLATALQAHYDDRLRVHFDGCIRDAFLAQPDRFYAQPVATPARNLAEAVSVLVLEPDGALVPAAYGLSRTLAVGDVGRARLRDCWQDWMERGYPRFRALAAAVFAEVATSPGLVAFDWYSRLSAASHSPVEATA